MKDKTMEWKLEFVDNLEYGCMLNGDANPR